MKNLFTLILLAFAVLYFSPAANARTGPVQARHKHHKHHKHHHRHHHAHRQVTIIEKV